EPTRRSIEAGGVPVAMRLAPGAEAFAPQRKAAWIETGRTERRLEEGIDRIGRVRRAQGTLDEERAVAVERPIEARQDGIVNQERRPVTRCDHGAVGLAGERIEGRVSARDAGSQNRVEELIAGAESFDGIGRVVL